jgi:hypothetical protein
VPTLRKIETPLLALGTIDIPVRNEFCVNNYDLTLNYLVDLKENRVFFKCFLSTNIGENVEVSHSKIIKVICIVIYI